MYMQVCSLNLAGGVVSLYASRRLTEEEAMLVVTVLAELATKAPQVCSTLTVFCVPSPHPSTPHCSTGLATFMMTGVVGVSNFIIIIIIDLASLRSPD